MRVKTIKRGGIILNETNTPELQCLISNFRPTFRYEEFEGRKHMVVPMVMLVEGVHAGSSGPLLYRNKELGSNPSKWNHMPVVVYHPQRNGQGVSARDPEVLKTYGVGMVFNSAHQGNRLKAEAWLDVERTNKVDERVIKNIEAGKVTEISTGLFSGFDQTEGVWNGEEYSAEVQNIRPDHLAILPDKKGACSVDKGAGLLRNKSSNQKESKMDKKVFVLALIANSLFVETDQEFLLGLEDDQLRKMGPTLNDDGTLKEIKKEEPKKVVKITKAPVANVDDKKKEEPKKVDEKKVSEMTPDEYINNAPPAIRDMLATGLATHNDRKSVLVEAIVKNDKNTFTKEQLELMTVNQLQSISALAGIGAEKAKPTYAGLADAFGAHQVNNANLNGNTQLPKIEALPLPTMTFGSK